MGSHAAPRLPSFAYRGFHAYSITCCTFERHRWFVDAAIVDAVSSSLLLSATDNVFEVPAYCFMPDHVHLLLQAASIDSDLLRMMIAWKQRTGFAHARATGARLWQNGYYDHVLRRENDLLKVIRYLVDNPVRAGLVRDISDYPFWGSGIWQRCELLAAIQTVGSRGG